MTHQTLSPVSSHLKSSQIFNPLVINGWPKIKRSEQHVKENRFHSKVALFVLYLYKLLHKSKPLTGYVLA